MGNSKKYKILAFDPGLGNTGWSLLEATLGSADLTILKMGEFHPGPTSDRALYKESVEKFQKRVISLTLLREEVTKLLNEYNPDFVCCEDIYISMLHPSAYGALAMWVCTVMLTVKDVAGKRLTTIPTKICKKAMTGSGGNGKLSVQAAIVSNPRINFKHEDDKMHMTEHEADSVAVGVAFHQNERDYILFTLGQN